MGSQHNVTISEEQKSEEMLDKSLCSRQRKIHEQRDVPKDRKLEDSSQEAIKITSLKNRITGDNAFRINCIPENCKGLLL